MERCGVGVRLRRCGLLFVGLRGAAAPKAAALEAEAEGYAEAGDEESGDDDYDGDDGGGKARCYLLAFFVCVAEVVRLAASVCFTDLRRGGGEQEGKEEECRSEELRGRTHGEGKWWCCGSVCGSGIVFCVAQGG